jgi:hypothetical protein
MAFMPDYRYDSIGRQPVESCHRVLAGRSSRHGSEFVLVAFYYPASKWWSGSARRHDEMH